MNIGIIGSGAIGSVLAAKLVKLGHKVNIANSRGPESLKEISVETGAYPVTVQQAVINAELVIVTIPQKSIPDLPDDLFQHIPQNVAVIDTGNYYPGLRDGVIPGIEADVTESEWVQNHIHRPVIKVFNSIQAASLKNLGQAEGEKNRIALPVSGDNTETKQLVMQIVNELGFDPIDFGKISDSWKQQPGTSIYCADLNKEQLVAGFNEMEAFRTPEIRKSIEINRELQVEAYLKSLSAG